MRKFTLMILTLLLVAVFTVTPALAADTGASVTGPDSCKPGETLETTLSVSGLGQVDSIAVSFSVPDGMELVKGEWLITGVIADVNAAKGQAVWTSSESITLDASTPIIKLTLKAKELTQGTSQVDCKVKFTVKGVLASQVLDTVSAEKNCTVTASTACSHQLVEVAAKAPTCEAAGNKQHYVCSACGQVFEADGTTETTAENVALAALGHTGGKATCSKKAVCSVCGESYGNRAKHSYGKEWSSDESGHWHVCSVCDAAQKAEAHEAETVNAVEATDTQEGYTGDSVCAVCGYEIAKGESIPCLATEEPTEEPTEAPTEAPTEEPTAEPTEAPTEETEPQAQEPQKSGFSWWWILVIIAVGAVVGVAVAVRNKKRGA